MRAPNERVGVAVLSNSDGPLFELAGLHLTEKALKLPHVDWSFRNHIPVIRTSKVVHQIPVIKEKEARRSSEYNFTII